VARLSVRIPELYTEDLAMKHEKVNRRHLLAFATGVGLGAFAPGATAQQAVREPKLPYPPKDFGSIHGDMLRTISENLKGVAIETEEGLLEIVDLLKSSGVINDTDAAVIQDLIRTIFASADPEQLTAKIELIYKDAATKAGDVAAAIVSIARNSVEHAKDYAKEHPRQIYIVASDVGGALAGAYTGGKFGTIFAAVGALAGAVGASAKAAFETRK
jgi:hypothetical protein